MPASKTKTSTAKVRRSKTETPKMGGSEVAARAIAVFVDEKKGERVAVLDVRELSSFTDFLVIVSGNSEPHLKAIASGIREGMREQHAIKAHSEDGSPGSQWLVLDYIDVVVHLFAADKREFYGMEDLWGDAPLLKLS